MFIDAKWLSRFGRLLLAGLVALILLLALGLFSPRPKGRLAWQTWPQTAVSIPPNQLRPTLLFPPQQAAPPDNFTVRLTTTWQQGELDSGIGLKVGETAVWVAPTGYLAVQSGCAVNAVCTQTVLPWQWWPHVRPEAALNEIWLSVENGRLSIRINREWLEIGHVTATGGEIVVIGESFGSETAVYQLHMLELFTHR